MSGRPSSSLASRRISFSAARRRWWRTASLTTEFRSTRLRRDLFTAESGDGHRQERGKQLAALRGRPADRLECATPAGFVRTLGLGRAGLGHTGDRGQRGLEIVRQRREQIRAEALALAGDLRGAPLLSWRSSRGSRRTSRCRTGTGSAARCSASRSARAYRCGIRNIAYTSAISAEPPAIMASLSPSAATKSTEK